MSIGPLGENLIFLISQPRAGSTLLQRMLAANTAIATAAEPWIMLHPFYALREGYEADYKADNARLGLRGLIDQMPGGEDDYYEGVRLMYRHLYNRAMHEEACCFLDKTPRYYLVVPELLRTFPRAKVLFLLRNPVAVLHSLIATWAPHGRLFHLSRWPQDLYEAPRLLADGMGTAGEQGKVLQYESITAEPDVTLRETCMFLGIEFDSGMVAYGEKKLPRWSLGDPKSVYAQSRPDPANAAKWMNQLVDPQLWRLSREYLEAVGEQTFARLGYDYEETRELLERHRPRGSRLWMTHSLRWLSRPEGHSRLQRIRIRLCNIYRTHGFLLVCKYTALLIYNRTVGKREDGEASE